MPPRTPNHYEMFWQLMDNVTPIMNRTVGRRIRVCRKILGISQGELAGRLGVSQGFVSKLENGGIVNAAVPLSAFCKSLSVSPYDLVLGTDE